MDTKDNFFEYPYFENRAINPKKQYQILLDEIQNQYQLPIAICLLLNPRKK